MHVLPLRPRDRAAWEIIWSLYFQSFGRDLPAGVTEATWQKIHDERVPVHGLAAWDDEAMVGMALSVVHLATRSVAPHYYLSDLFVVEAARRRGVGRALVEATFERARASGCDRLYWLTHDTNEPARRLYDTMAESSGLVEYRRRIG